MHTLNDSDQPLSYVCKNVLVESQRECLVESQELASGCFVESLRGFFELRGLKGGIGTDRNNRGSRFSSLRITPARTGTRAGRLSKVKGDLPDIIPLINLSGTIVSRCEP